MADWGQSVICANVNVGGLAGKDNIKEIIVVRIEAATALFLKFT